MNEQEPTPESLLAADLLTALARVEMLQIIVLDLLVDRLGPRSDAADDPAAYLRRLRAQSAGRPTPPGTDPDLAGIAEAASKKTTAYMQEIVGWIVGNLEGRTTPFAPRPVR